MANSKNMNPHLKSTRYKTAILGWYRIFMNLTMFINASATKNLTAREKISFTCLRQVLIEIQILLYFDLEYYIQIENDVLGYALGRVFN